MQINNWKHQLNVEMRLLFVLLCTCVLGSLYFYGVDQTRQIQARKNELISTLPNSFADISLVARNAVVYVPNEDMILFARHELSTRPLASLTKIMTSYVAMREMDTTLPIVIDEESTDVYGNEGLEAGDEWLLPELIKFTMTVSSNDATEAIKRNYDARVGTQGESLFIRKMNELAQEQGFATMTFNSASGLDDEGIPSAKGSALDTAKLFGMAFNSYPSVFLASGTFESTYKTLGNKEHLAYNRNPLTKKWHLLASKTGYTTAAGGNLAVMTDFGTGTPIVIVVLGSTELGRFQDIDTLLTHTQEYVSAVYERGLKWKDLK